MNSLMDLAMRVQSIAQAGLAYGKNEYDLERYEELRDIAAQMVAINTDIPVEIVKMHFCNEDGYQTPKVDTRAVIFQDGKILLVHEKNGTWALPGGWCDVDQSIASNIEKETKEEAGLEVKADQVIAVQDWRKHNKCNLPYGVVKIFVQCNVIGGNFQENIETTESKYFTKEELPENLAVEKVTKEQIRMCFEAYESDSWKTLLD